MLNNFRLDSLQFVSYMADIFGMVVQYNFNINVTCNLMLSESDPYQNLVKINDVSDQL